MKIADARKLIGKRVMVWTAANGNYVGTLIEVAGSPWRGTVKIDGILLAAHHSEFGQVVRRGFRVGELIEAGNSSISATDAEGVTNYVEILKNNILRLEELLKGNEESPNAWALFDSIAANKIIIEAEERRLATGEWKQPRGPARPIVF